MHILQLYSGQDISSGDFIYRIERPARGLQQIPGVKVENRDLLAMLDVSALLVPDVLILHHVSDPDLLSVISRREKRKKITIYELADNFRASQSGSRNAADSNERHFIMEEMVRRCDAIQTTSLALKKRFHALSKGFLVFPNYIGELCYKSERPKKNAPFVFGWGGSVRHYADLRHYASAITEWVLTNPDTVFAVMGSKRIAGLFGDIPAKQFRYVAGGSLSDYLDFISTLDVGIAPLLPNEFNACRSDVKYLEYASTKVCPLCARYGPYLEIGVAGENILYFDSPGELIDNLAMLRRNNKLCRTIADNAYRWVAENRLDSLKVWQAQLRSYKRLIKRNIKKSPPRNIINQEEKWSQHVSNLLARAIQCQQPDKALGFLDAAQEIAPDNYQVYYFRGWLLSQISSYEEAAVNLKKALQYQPDSIRTLQLLAQIQMLQLDLEGSWQTLTQLKLFLPQHPATRRIAKAIAQINKHQLQVAI